MVAFKYVRNKQWYVIQMPLIELRLRLLTGNIFGRSMHFAFWFPIYHNIVLIDMKLAFKKKITGKFLLKMVSAHWEWIFWKQMFLCNQEKRKIHVYICIRTYIHSYGKTIPKSLSHYSRWTSVCLYPYIYRGCICMMYMCMYMCVCLCLRADVCGCR